MTSTSQDGSLLAVRAIVDFFNVSGWSLKIGVQLLVELDGTKSV